MVFSMNWLQPRLILTTICFLSACWVLFHSYSVYQLYQSATQAPVAISPPAYRHEESCRGAFAAPKNVAIIGAGAAGASTAYHLRRYASPCQPLNVTVFERRHYVGGRSTTVHIHDDPAHPVELGASIFVAVNHILVETAAELGLRNGDDDDERIPIPRGAASDELGVWDGSQFRFLLPRDEPTWRLAARLLWQYGTAPLRVQTLMRQTVDGFLSLYSRPIFPFASLTRAAAQAELLHTTGQTGAAFLADNKVGLAYATDIVQASTRVNYAQDLSQIHALEAMVCMAAEGGARSIRGGNWRIFAGMIAASEASLRLETAVESITQNPGGSGLTLRTNTSRDDWHFDAVVLAAPWGQAELAVSPHLASHPSKVDYVSLHVTLFTSHRRLRPSYFHRRSVDGPPKTILTTRSEGDKKKLPFFSISLLRVIENTRASPPHNEFAYKIFSPAPLSDDFLLELLDDRITPNDKGPVIKWSHRKVWDAYPYLPPRTSFDEPEMPFENGESGIYYTSGMESFISTMETSALMGRNVAMLLAEQFEREAGGDNTTQLRVQPAEPAQGKIEMTRMEL